MKKTIICLCLTAILLVGALAFTACDDKGGPIAAPTVSEESAKSIALNNLGVAVSNANFAATATSYIDGAVYYDVEFTIDGIKYEYRINSQNGNIAHVEINDQTVTTDATPLPPANPTTSYIGEEAAITAALAHAGVERAAAASVTSHLDYDDGLYLYEVEFTAGEIEYEYEINAITGAVFKQEIDRIAQIVPAPSDPTVTYVTKEAAIAAAVQAAGVDAASITLKKATFEIEEGTHVYEIEFVSGNVEYEYDVNAVTGTVVPDSVYTPATPGSGSYIGVEAAKNAALAHAKFGAADVVFTEAALDVDRGVYVYEVEFTAGGYEYEYEINATTGAVVKFDKERAND